MAHRTAAPRAAGADLARAGRPRLAPCPHRRALRCAGAAT
jgi:hypothetical protein